MCLNLGSTLKKIHYTLYKFIITLYILWNDINTVQNQITA